MRSKRFVQATLNILGEKMETISVKFLTQVFVTYPREVKNFIADEENWNFPTRITLECLGNQILIFSQMVALIICARSV